MTERNVQPIGGGAQRPFAVLAPIPEQARNEAHGNRSVRDPATGTKSMNWLDFLDSISTQGHEAEVHFVFCWQLFARWYRLRSGIAGPAGLHTQVLTAIDAAVFTILTFESSTRPAPTPERSFNCGARWRGLPPARACGLWAQRRRLRCMVLAARADRHASRHADSGRLAKPMPARRLVIP
jgi:hypothetical protein